ncbi:MAG: cellulase family glycosylhydrolase [Paludibacteraceae bacterium]|nr:cellulase family glycosylhydrolase [Paludibacteraceae bacterium]
MKKLLTLVSLLLMFLQGNALDYSNPRNNNYINEWGRLKLVGNQLCSQSGEPIQLRGWSTHGSWFMECYNDKGDFEKMKNEGANIARIAQYVTEGSGVDKQWVKNCIDYTAELGMYCLVDWHILKPGNPNDGGYGGYGDFFREMISHVKSKGYKHVLWEICNEPNDDVEGAPAEFDYVWDWIKEYAQKVLPIIGEGDPDAVVMVGTPQWDQDVTRAFQDPIEIKDSFKGLQIMYSFHHYAADQQRYLGILSGAAAFVPVFITEWGLSSHTGDSGVDTKAGDHMLLVANGKNLGGQIISWANWSWSDKGESSGTFTGGGYGGLSFSESGNYIRQQLKKGDNFKFCETTPYESAQVFDGEHDFYLDLGAYDKGGQDNAYFDYDEDWACPNNNKNNEHPCNAGDAGKEDGFRASDEFFDIGYSDKNDKENAYKTLGYIGNGEWVTYTIEVQYAGDYEFEAYACNHPDYNTFAIAVDGKPGLVDEEGKPTRYQALYLPPCKGGQKDDYNTWGWVTPYSEYNESIKHLIHFDKPGKHTISFAFMTSFSGLGSFKIKGQDHSSLSLIRDEQIALWPNPSENGSFNLTVGADSDVKILNAQGACVYSNNVAAGKIAQLNLNLASGVYVVSIESEKGVSTQKLIVK